MFVRPDNAPAGLRRPLAKRILCRRSPRVFCRTQKRRPSSSPLRLQLAKHEVVDGIERPLVFEEHAVYLAGDRHIDSFLACEIVDRSAGPNTLRHGMHAFEDLLE